MCASQRSARGSGTAASPTLIDAKAAGRLLNVPPSWVLAQARKDAIPHVKLGHYTRFFEDELLDWARNGQHRGPRAATAGAPRAGDET